MPTDKSGKFHMNTQRMHAAERMASEAKPKSMKMGMEAAEPAHEHESVGHVTVHDHGDGTYHTEHEDGAIAEHPHVGHMLMHLASHHEPGKHMHIMENPEGGHKSHQVGHDGEPEGHDHENLEALKDHMDQFLNEEEHEGDWGEGKGYGGHEESLAGL